MPYIGHSPEVAQRRYESIDDISGSFNGSTTSFALQVGGVTPAPFPVASENVLISVGGVIQEPDGGGTNGFQLTGTNIVFSSAPASGQSFFGVILAGADYVTAGHAFPDGDLASPSITFASDLDTGLFRPDSGALAFGGNGAERLRVDGSGRLLLGTTTEGEATADNFTIADSGHCGITLRSGTGSVGTIFFSDGTSGTDEYRGYVQYDHSGNFLKWATDATERMRIDSSGRVLINHTADTSPSGYEAKLQLCDTSYQGSTISVRRDQNNAEGSALAFVKSRATSKGGSTVVQDDDNIGEIRFFAADGTDANSTCAEIKAFIDGTPGGNDTPGRLSFHTTADGASTPTERMRIDSSGNVGIGVTSPGRLLEAKNSASGEVVAARFSNGQDDGSSDSASIVFGLARTGGLIHEAAKIKAVKEQAFTATPSTVDASLSFEIIRNENRFERLKIESIGRSMFFSEEAVTYMASAAGAGTSHALITGVHSNSTVSLRAFTNGNIQNTNNSYGSLSDSKLKENIVDANSQWNDIKDIRVRNYNFIEGETHTQLGVIAQEVETVSPGLVYETPDTDDDGNDLGTVTKSVNYSVLYMKAVKALQEAQTRIETLETQNTAQQTQIDDLLARVTALEST